MSDLLAAIILRRANQSQSVKNDSNIVAGCFGSATGKPPRNFHVQMNNLDAGDSSLRLGCSCK